MKKVFLILAMIFCTLGSFAQSSSNVAWFRTTEFAWKYKEYGVWSDWTDWEKSNMKVKFDFNKIKIKL